MERTNIENTAKAGFTLIELMVVVVLIGTLSAIAIPFYQKFIAKSKMAETTVLINQLSIKEIHFYDTDQVASNFMVLDNQYEATTNTAGVPPINDIGNNKQVTDWNQSPFNTIEFKGPSSLYCSYAVMSSGIVPLRAIQINAACNLDNDITTTTHPAFNTTAIDHFYLFTTQLSYDDNKHNRKAILQTDRN